MPRPTSWRLHRRQWLVLGGALGLALAGTPARAATPPINTLKNSVFGGRTDTAINGYDTVAYFTLGKPVKGQDRWATEWMGAQWKFSSQAHLDLFKANPSQYAPQFGGYCAYGVTQGALVKVEPEQFTVRDGKLYLNYDADIQAKWLNDQSGYIRDAQAKFPVLLSK